MRVAILNCDFAKRYLEQYGDFADMAITMLEKTRGQCEMTDFTVYQVHKNEFPTLDILREFSGIYITGSESDSFDNSTPWIIRLRQLVAELLKNEDYPPIAGVCFGHQIVASSLGCKVARNVKGFEGGIVDLQLTSDAVNAGLFQRSPDSPTKNLKIVEVHHDIVYEVPQGYTNVGSSSKCSIQGLYKKNRLFTLQGHPEFVTEVSSRILDNMYQCNHLTSKERNDLEASSQKQDNQGYFAATYIWKLFCQDI
ncbi:LADA_0E06942g1_1 [Lachancea dasiensis]|uniref:LADA_0E06942g1_1 n=1 Tax=Lachancea dasiensis TaxID=1072105 RepID=A0A1G4JCM3_9SACH|nr:LADA_0E06942g1_1 [Lachancea dasiensis]